LKVLLRRITHNKIDGIVLECNHLWMMKDIYPQWAKLVETVGTRIREKNKLFVLVLYPYADTFTNVLDRAKFEYLARYVDFFSIMSYDYISYISKSNQKFNAPLTWMNKTIEHYVDLSKSNKDVLTSKILLGLPFHGVMTEMGTKEPKGSQLDASSFTSLISADEETKMTWDDSEGEHQIYLNRNNKEYVASYPTKKVLF
jgi:GH18 family chitinase